MAISFLIGMAGMFPAAVFAEGTPDRPAEPAVNVVEKSRPVFDPELFKKRPAEDQFLAKVRQKKAEFQRKQLEEKRELFEKLRKKDLPPDKMQKEVLEFNRRQKKKLEKFLSKQQKKINKHLEKGS